MMRLYALLLLLSILPAAAESFYLSTANEPKAMIAVEYSGATGSVHGTIILCHGYRADRSIWNSYIGKFNKAGWATVAFDFRGHGQSSGSLLDCTLGYQEVWDIKAVTDWARSRRLPQPYVLYGVSMGGSVALRYAGMFDDPCVAGVLADSPYANGRTGARQYLGILADVPLGIGGMGQMLSQVDIPEALHHRRAPLKIWITLGEKDCFPVSDGEKILAAAPPDPANKLMVLPGLGHGQHWQRPEENDAKIFGFLKQFESSDSYFCFAISVLFLVICGLISYARRNTR